MSPAQPPAKPTLVFDGHCGFCRCWIERWRQRTGDRVNYEPTDPAAPAPGAVVLLTPHGERFTGAAAVLRTLAGRWSLLLWLYQRLPGFAPLSEWAYRFVADHRPLFSWLTRLLYGSVCATPSYRATRSLFLRAVGLIYGIAFLSLWTQLDGLIGANGILPAARLMDALREQSLPHNGWAAYWLAPTLCWLNASDAFLHVLCGAGVALAILVMAGIGVAPALAGLWIGYLSLAVVADVFLGYQWDALLLETGALAFLFALGKRAEPSRAALWLLRLLLFKLMFFSGVVKLVSGDALWRNLTALTVHYETQPLPNTLAWHLHQAPLWFHQLACGAMFFIELALPLLIFAPRRPRALAAGGLALFQLLIVLTGNYTFFNWLALALCIPLLDDRLLRLPSLAGPPTAAPARWRGWLTGSCAVVITFMTVIQTAQVCRWRIPWPRPVVASYVALHQTLHPLRSVNTYGLFAVMTPNRPEIILEGSRDGVEWRAYEFRWKPGDPARRPRQVAPHQPRLDWQMWFEALRPPGQPSRWFLGFCARLLEGEPAVVGLLESNPFPAAPPRYLRPTLQRYRFTDRDLRARTGEWWLREPLGPYTEILSLREPAE